MPKNQHDLKTIRKATGLSQEDLASLLSLKQVTLSQIETGRRVPRQSTRRKVESILGNEIDWVKTLSRDRDHIIYFLVEFLNPGEGNIQERIAFIRQALNILEDELTTNT